MPAVCGDRGVAPLVTRCRISPDDVPSACLSRARGVCAGGGHDVGLRSGNACHSHAGEGPTFSVDLQDLNNVADLSGASGATILILHHYRGSLHRRLLASGRQDFHQTNGANGASGASGATFYIIAGTKGVQSSIPLVGSFRLRTSYR